MLLRAMLGDGQVGGVGVLGKGRCELREERPTAATSQTRRAVSAP
jgi:hypothetical protein